MLETLLKFNTNDSKIQEIPKTDNKESGFFRGIDMFFIHMESLQIGRLNGLHT